MRGPDAPRERTTDEGLANRWRQCGAGGGARGTGIEGMKVSNPEEKEKRCRYRNAPDQHFSISGAALRSSSHKSIVHQLLQVIVPKALSNGVR